MMSMIDLYWIDLETTGLNPSVDVILEIAVSKATLQDPFEATPIYHRILRCAKPNLDAFIVDMHTKHGLLAECSQSDAGVLLAEKELLELVPEAQSKSTKPVLAGSSIHF